MFRTLDLSNYSSNASQLLNDPCLRLIKMNISCDFETGHTTVSMRLSRCEPREIKFKRYLKRFFVDQWNDQLDEMLKNKNIRIIKQHVFPTIEGTIVVLDYQIKSRKAGRS